jgi:replicative DNA helicase Mcm
MEFEEAMNRFRDFLETFPSMDNPVYMQEINRCRVNYLRSLSVDFEHVLDHDYELAQLVIDEPMFALPACDAAFETLYRPEQRIDLHVRFYNVTPARVEIRDLRSEHINKLVQIEGVVRRISEVKPEIVEAVFECQRCSQLLIVEQDSHIFQKPTMCTNPACGRQGPFKLIENQSKFVDWQSVKVQERPERLRGGRMPRSVDCIIRDDIVDRAQAGNRVNIVGILKTQQETASRGLKTTFHIYAEVNHVEMREKVVEEIEISKEDEEEIRRLSAEPFICEKIVSSIAPAIYGHEDVKEAIALQLFSGVFRVLSDGTRLRGDSNILLVGDPGTAKSQILQYVARLAPRGVYTSGKGVSGVGLTAAVVRDELTGGWALEAGALVLADGGLCAIDELDKMSTDDRSAIHEALEQQSYHPETELLLSTGKKVKIGEFVDGLMENQEPVKGIDCEILPVSGYELVSIRGAIPVERVSRHKAPDRFIRIRYSNGREITVTPEHPVFVYDEGGIRTIPAEQVHTDLLVPGVAKHDITEGNHLDHTPTMNKIRFPQEMTFKLARLLGYITGAGHIFFNKKNKISEVVIFSRDRQIIEDAKSILQEEFGAYSFIHDRKRKETPFFKLRCPCLPLYEFFKMNFPELVGFFSKKRVPHKILQCPPSLIGEFLKSALTRCGISNTLGGEPWMPVEGGQILVRTRELAEDFQDAFLCMGILTSIHPQNFHERELYALCVQPNPLNFNQEVSVQRDSSGLVTVLGNPDSTEQPALHLAGPAIDKGRSEPEGEGESFDKNGIYVLRVEQVEEICNHAFQWVYDVTVANHMFAAAGLFLHNTISIAKAGVVATLNARTSVLAACNPKYGRFDRYKSITDQIDLPSTLLSRFDLVYIITDTPREDTDRRIAEHIVNIHRRPDEAVTQPIPLDLLEKYIMYAKNNVKPGLTKEAAQKLMNFYMQMRKGGESEDAPVPITARQLEALIRLSEARARMHLAERVEKEDSEEVIRLFRECLVKVAIDMETGKMDIDTLMTGTRKSQRDKILILRDIIEDLDKGNQDNGAQEEDVFRIGQDKGLSESFVREYLAKFKHDGDIYEPRPGFLKMLREY